MKRVMVVFLALVLCLLLCACVKSEDVVGNFEGSYTHGGATFDVSIWLSYDGNYFKVVLKNGEPHSGEEGDYELKGNKVILYDSSSLTHHGKATEYKYKKDALVNNGHTFTKKY